MNDAPAVPAVPTGKTSGVMAAVAAAVAAAPAVAPAANAGPVTGLVQSAEPVVEAVADAGLAMIPGNPLFLDPLEAQMIHAALTLLTGRLEKLLAARGL